MKLSFENMMLKLSIFNMYKRPLDKEDNDSENEDIELIKSIIEGHI